MMKKLWCFGAFALAGFLVGCGGGEDPGRADLPGRAEEDGGGENTPANLPPISADVGTAAASTGSGDWAGFRGPGGNGRADGGDPPVTWSGDAGVVWKMDLPGPGASSPVVFGEKVFVTCHTGYGLSPDAPGDMEDLERVLLCFRLSDGEKLWEKSVRAEMPEGAFGNRMHWHGYASQTPAVDAEAVYCFFGKSGVYALSHGGEAIWNVSVGAKTHEWGSGTSPVLFEDLVIVNAFVESGALVALDKKTGEERWRAEGLTESWNTPALAVAEGGETELAVGVSGKVLGFDPKSGEALWEAKAADWYVVPSIVSEGGVLYSLAGKGYEATTAIRAGGRGDVTGTHRLWQTRMGSNVSSPVLHDGRVYFAHEQGSTAYCLDAKTGEEIYQERIPARMEEIYASPVLAAGRIYYFGRNGTGLVVEAGRGFEVLATNAPLDDGKMNASPAVVGERLLVRTDKALYCLGK